jgi:cytochrome c peroxidase
MFLYTQLIASKSTRKKVATMVDLVKAIEVFEATLLTPDAPFDRYLKGE